VHPNGIINLIMPLDLKQQLERRNNKGKVLIEHYVMKTYTGVGVQIHIFLTSALVGSEWSALRLGRFTPAEITPGTYKIGGCAGPKAGLDVVEI
jgi:hypothetical protein